jgi:NADPH:quinone reductase-like Zn-dependent oxidoreductase
VLPFGAPPDLNALMRKSASFHWTFMFTRSLFDTPDLARQGWILAQVAQWVDQGLLRSTLAEDLGPICARGLRGAHQRLERGDTVGKLVLSGLRP